jgi:hypothetical protein
MVLRGRGSCSALMLTLCVHSMYCSGNTVSWRTCTGAWGGLYQVRFGQFTHLCTSRLHCRNIF